jgi:histone H3/H4
MQASTKHMIPRSCFTRLVKEMIGKGYRVTEGASHMLQNESEEHLTKLFSNAGLLAQMTGRETIVPMDLHIQSALR